MGVIKWMVGYSWILVLFAVVFLSVIFSRKAYLVSQKVHLRIIVFATLFITGCLIYWHIPVDDISVGVSNELRGLSAVNRVFATFFPSRGGFETVKTVETKNNSRSNFMGVVSGNVCDFTSNSTEIAAKKSDNHLLKGSKNCESKESVDSQCQTMRFLYYAWHLCVVCFVSMLVFSAFLGLYCIGTVKRRWDYIIARLINIIAILTTALCKILFTCTFTHNTLFLTAKPLSRD